jgi:hypothetical protein
MAENLKNTLLIEGTEYNINAVHSEFADEATKTKASLTLTKSLSTGDDKSQIFDGENNKEIKYVPASGGKFTGPVFIDSDLDDIDAGIINQAIINYGQITSKIADLDGAPLYTLDAGGQIYASTDANKTDYKLNTVVGTTQGLEALKRIGANPNGSAGIKYSYDETSKSYTVEGPDPDAGYFDPNVVIPAIYKDPVTNIEAPVTTIKEKAFYENLNITSAVLPSSITSIGGINKGTTAPGIQVFYGCKNLVSINIPDGVKIIPSSTFNGCTKLKNLKLGSGVTTIGSSAFSQCDSLESVIIPEKVTKIEGFAFNGCENLASVVIPKSLTTIGEQIFDVAASTPASDLKIYYTGTKAQWETLLANNVKFPSGSAAGLDMPNRRIKAETTTVTYEYKITPVGDLISFKEFIDNPILYICKDQETAGSPVSNKMFLKLPGDTSDFIEISKGAARLESPSGATTQGYYTYETLAAILAGINARLAALGGDNLKLPTELPETNSVIIPNGLHTEVLEDPFDSANVITLQGLQDAIDALAGTEGGTGNGESLSKLRGDLNDVIDDLEELVKEVAIELDGQESKVNLNGRLTTVETYIANTLPGELSGKAAASHGNHVPTTVAEHNDKKFLRSDNKWADVTPANIGAAAAHEHPYLPENTNYAGSSSKGGAATSAEKLSNTSAIGNATTPVYFSAEGVPVVCTSLSLNTTGKATTADSAATADSATTAGTAGALHDTTNTANSYTYSSIKAEFDGIKNGTTELNAVTIKTDGKLKIGNTELNEAQLQKILNFIDSIELI